MSEDGWDEPAKPNGFGLTNKSTEAPSTAPTTTAGFHFGAKPGFSGAPLAKEEAPSKPVTSSVFGGEKKTHGGGFNAFTMDSKNSHAGTKASTTQNKPLGGFTATTNAVKTDPDSGKGFKTSESAFTKPDPGVSGFGAAKAAAFSASGFSGANTSSGFNVKNEESHRVNAGLGSGSFASAEKSKGFNSFGGSGGDSKGFGNTSGGFKGGFNSFSGSDGDKKGFESTSGGFTGVSGGKGFGTSSKFGGGFGQAGSSTGGDRSKACFLCGEEGHRANECHSGKSSTACYNCRQEGHRSAECNQPRKEKSGGGGCFNCGKEGHRSNECPEPRKEREDGRPASTFVPPEEDTEALYHSGVEKGSLFDKLFDAAVSTTLGGLEQENGKVDVFERFSDLHLGDKIQQNITTCGYSVPTPVQKHAMPIIKEGKDLLACAQTGSGKTAAFLLPILSKLYEDKDLSSAAELGCFPRCLVIAPTRELAVQIFNESRKFARGTVMSSCVVYGGTHVGYQKGQLAGGATVVVGTIGRLLQFVEDGTISLEKLRFLVLDEADRMLDMGFGQDIARLVQHKTMPNKKVRQTLMFSATFPSDVQAAARLFLKDDYTMITVDAIGAANKCITQELVMCEHSEKKDRLLDLLEIDRLKYTIDKTADVFNKKTLIFVSKKSFADTLGAIVSSAGLPTTTIHGDRLQNERHEALRDFASGRKAVMIATAVAERGLDIKGVDHVINYDLPDEIDQYVHRIGRTGRVGNSGRATSFYVAAFDQKLAAGLLKCMTDAQQVVPEWLPNEAIGGYVPPSNNSGFKGGFSNGFQEEAW